LVGSLDKGPVGNIKIFLLGLQIKSVWLARETLPSAPYIHEVSKMWDDDEEEIIVGDEEE
jgi:hypothetical protein